MDVIESTLEVEEEKKRGLKRNTLISIVIGILIVLGIAVLEFSQIEKYRPIVHGSKAPDFSLTDLDGKNVRLSDYKGKVVFLNFWATWCIPCKEEMPSMEFLYRRMKGQPFEILAVSIDKQGKKVVNPFMEELRLTFPALLDRRQRVSDLYKLTGVPETFIIDKEGKVVEKIIGATDWSDPKTIEYFRILTRDGKVSWRLTKEIVANQWGIR